MLLLLSAARAAPTQPEILLAGEQAIAVTIPVSDGELRAAELAPTAGSTSPLLSGADWSTSTKPG